MLSDKVSLLFFCGPGQRRRRERGWGVGGFLPEPRTLSEGNYILIPLRNLVCIRLPGTSANCLQCLSLCLLGVCMCVCVYQVFCEHTAPHKYTRSQTGLSKAVTRPETLHTPVLLLCKWILLIIVSILVFYFWGYFFPIDKKSNKKKSIQKKTNSLLVGLE